MELSLSSDEFGDSRDIDPAAAASAADQIAEFVSASEEVLGTVMSEGPRHGAIIQSRCPLGVSLQRAGGCRIKNTD